MGVKKPTFASDDKIHSFERIEYSDVALLCEVQAYPIATIRYEIISTEDKYLNF